VENRYESMKLGPKTPVLACVTLRPPSCVSWKNSLTAVLWRSVKQVCGCLHPHKRHIEAGRAKHAHGPSVFHCAQAHAKHKLICTLACSLSSISTSTCTCTYINTHVCTYTHAQTRTHTLTPTHCTCTRINTHVCTYTHAHTHT